ncbi:MAG TPA: NAD(P)/FAD-dependent oxidoreductase [Casimicrobiaceae bacterium]|jgi:NADH dehydrogenase|nr:NAD(P)/FAD-dependent oxidoreductase [Casimicrobiaceae bacterium]
MAATRSAHRVIIVGGGAGGLPLAARLGDKLARRGLVHVTLVDRYTTHLWKPLLHEVAAGTMDADIHGVDYFALGYWHRFVFRLGTVTGLDRAHHALTLSAVADDDGMLMLPQRTLAYDTLVFCVGSVSNDFGVPGVAEHAISLDTQQDAERFHRRLLAACVRANAAASDGDRSGVGIVIIGAGATGVELAAEIRHTTGELAPYGLESLHPRDDIRLTIVEAAPRILPQLSERIATAATGLLSDLGVEVHVGERVTSVEAGAVNTASGAIHKADLIVWSAGIKAPEWLGNLGLETNRANQLVVSTALQTTRDADIFAFGDCAACPWPEEGPKAIVPPRAQAAHQQATLLVKTIRARLAGQPLPRFRFRDFGSLVSLGEMSAVGNLMGRLVGGSLLIQGLIARWMYNSLYKLHQVAILGYAGVALDTIGRLLRRRTEPRVKLH